MDVLLNGVIDILCIHKICQKSSDPKFHVTLSYTGDHSSEGYKSVDHQFLHDEGGVFFSVNSFTNIPCPQYLVLYLVLLMFLSVDPLNEK